MNGQVIIKIIKFDKIDANKNKNKRIAMSEVWIAFIFFGSPFLTFEKTSHLSSCKVTGGRYIGSSTRWQFATMLCEAG